MEALPLSQKMIRNFIRDNAYMGIASMGGSLLFFGAYAVVTRLISKTALGEYQIASTLMSIALLTAYPKMSGALITAGARKAHGIFAEGIRMIIKKSWQGIAILAVAAIYYAAQGTYELSGALFVAGMLFIPYAISGLYESHYVAIGNMRLYTIGSLAISLFLSIALVASAYFFPHSATMLSFAFFFTNAATGGAWTYHIAQKSTQLSPIQNNRESLEFAEKTSWTEYILQAANYADILLINAFLGPQDVAVYAVARMAPEAIKGLVKNAGVLSAARIATMQGHTIKKALIIRTVQATGIAIVVFITYALSAPLFFSFIFPSYPEALIYSQLLALSFLAFPAHLAESALGALLKKKEVIRLDSAAAGAMLLFSCALIPPFGIAGAVIARILARFSNAGVALYIALQSV